MPIQEDQAQVERTISRRFCALRSRATLPWVALGLILFASLLITITQADRYGVTVDEPLQQVFGEHTLAWYRTLGRDTSFLTVFAPSVHMPEHGGAFDALIAALQGRFPAVDPWLVRRLVSGITGWLGLVAIALCGFEMAGPWAAALAALGLWLYPRYEGAMYNNPKDVPATVLSLFALWATLLLLRYWEQSRRRIEVAVLLGCYLGAATAVRVTALSWFGVLAVIVVGWWAMYGRETVRERRVWQAVRRQLSVGAVVITCWFATTVALWPFVFLNPLTNLVLSIQVLSHYPWTGSVLFDGTRYSATQLPLTYVPTWLVIGSPPMHLLLAGIGVCAIGFDLARRRLPPPAVAVIALAFILQLGSLLLLRPTLYDGLRQFLYLIPPLILLAAYGAVRLASGLRASKPPMVRWVAIGLLALSILGCGATIADMLTLAPYEYAYFSPLVGGLPGAAGRYDTDYYGTCSTAATRWLSRHYRIYTSQATPTVGASPLLQSSIEPFLSADLREDQWRPTFYIGFTRDPNDQTFSTYQVIDVVASQGAPLCVVKVKPGAG